MTTSKGPDYPRLASKLRVWDEGDLSAARQRFRRNRAPKTADAGPRRLVPWLGATRRARRRPRAWVYALGTTLAGLALWFALLPKPEQAPLAQVLNRPARELPSKVMMMADGSRITLFGAETDARVIAQSPTEAQVVLNSGKARFDIKHDPARLVTVVVGNLRVVDIGTVFTLDRQAEELTVEVTEGAVRVYSGEPFTELVAGQSQTFPIERSLPPEPAGVSLTAEPDLAEAPSSEVSPVVRPRPALKNRKSQPTWQELAQQGRHKEAWALLSISKQRGHGATELLLAADVARLSGHPAQAVPPLQRLLAEYSTDPRTPAAAFTLGSLLLRQLGRPAAAASAFSKAERLAPAGNLAEDARARAAEAWHRAGNSQQARQALRHYEQRHPTGRHLTTLRALLGGS